MTTKLTLSIKSGIVNRAKKYAKKKGTSISKLFEEHILELTEGEPKEKTALESLKRLKGAAKGAVGADSEYKDIIADILIEKHLK